ncbi:type IV secretory system conjugative DNA transfer family protein, partial [Aquibium sp. LZ166]
MAWKFTDPSGFPYQPGSLFLGLDPSTGREVGIHTERHAITIAGARTGKGAAVLVPNARRWPHGLLTIDPKGENVELTWQHREALGQRVIAIDPYGYAKIPERLRASFNPLASINPNSITAADDLDMIADGLVRRTNPKNAEWDNGACMILAGMMAYVILSNPPEKRTLDTLRDILTQPKEIANEEGELIGGLYYHAQMMAACERHGIGKLARSASATIMDALENGKGMPPQLLDAAKRHSKWLDSEPITAALGASTFDLADIKTGKVSVYLVLPPDYIKTHAAFLRLFVRMALSAMARDRTGNGRCLFLLDEFYQLGKMDEIQASSGLMPGYGVHLWPFLQDLGQLHELYGAAGSKTFFANADVHMFFGIDQDADASKMVSDRIGPLKPDEITAPPPIDFTNPTLVNKRNPLERGGFWGSYKHGDMGLFGKDRDESDIARRIETEDENIRRAWENADEQTRRKIENTNAQRLAEYDHAMKRVGTPRIPPDEVAQLTGKGHGQKVANSMIVFGPRHVVLNLLLEPYFHNEAKSPEIINAGQPTFFDVEYVRDYWLGPTPLLTKIVVSCAAFIGSFGLAAALGAPPLVVWLFAAFGILVIPPLATITISKKLIIVGLFTFGCIVAIRTDSPFLAFPE